MSTETDTAAAAIHRVVVVPPAEDSVHLRRFSVDEYHQMVESGVLTENDRVQLVNGWIFEMPPIGPGHSTSVTLGEIAIRNCLPAGYLVRVHSPITVPSGEPEPDLAVVRGSARDYATRHPGPEDVLLVIEVADSTLSFDRVQKLFDYAGAGIAEYWIVDLINRQVEVFRDPQSTKAGNEYRFHEIVAATGSVKLRINGKEIAELRASELLP